LGGESPQEGAARGTQQEPEPMNHDRARACQTLLARIMELHAAGGTTEEIASQVLTSEVENVAFRAAVLIEIIVHQPRLSAEEKYQ